MDKGEVLARMTKKMNKKRRSNLFPPMGRRLFVKGACQGVDCAVRSLVDACLRGDAGACEQVKALTVARALPALMAKPITSDALVGGANVEESSNVGAVAALTTTRPTPEGF